MLNRRELLRSGALVAGAAAVPVGCAADDNALSLSGVKRGAELVRAGPLINVEQAHKVLTEEGLDALVVTRPLNFLYFTGYYDHFAVRINAPSSFALLARDEKRAPAVVMNQFIYYYSVADSSFDWSADVYLYTGWATADGPGVSTEHPETEPAVRGPFVFSDKGVHPERQFEKARLDALNQVLATHPPSADAMWALSKAIRSLGLQKARIGIDDPVIAGMIDGAGLTAETVDGDHAIRRIRIVKSPREIELMRIAAHVNAEAALAAVRAVRAGATHRELRATYFSEAALRGNTPVFLQIDTVTSEVFDAELKDGAAFAIDAVSHGFHYVGDYGRTIFIGEPSQAMKRVTDAIAIGWDAVREHLRPGVRYSQIRQIGRDAIKKAGYDLAVAVTPHSVGMSHTDEPGQFGSGGVWMKDDLVLEENMIISVDMPVLHTGIGGSAHLEDLTLITSDGSEQINDIGDRIVIV